MSSTKYKLVKIGQFCLIILVVALGIWFVNQVGIEQIRSNVQQFGSWAFLIVGGLRLTSVIIPALPGDCLLYISWWIIWFYTWLNNNLSGRYDFL